MLTSLPVRAQKDVRNTVEKTQNLRKYLNCLEQTVNRYMNFKCATGEDLDGKEEHVIRNWSKESPCIQWQKA